MDIKKRIQELSLDQKAKLYFMGLVRKGIIDRLPEDPKAAYIRDMMDKENPKMDPAIRSDFDDPMFEGDTYEKMAAKGKKRGNLKQGTVRKRLKIKDGEKIPLSKITKAISKIKKMKNPSEKNKKYLKALNLAKTLKTTTNVREIAFSKLNDKEKITVEERTAVLNYWLTKAKPLGKVAPSKSQLPDIDSLDKENYKGNDPLILSYIEKINKGMEGLYPPRILRQESAFFQGELIRMLNHPDDQEYIQFHKDTIEHNRVDPFGNKLTPEKFGITETLKETATKLGYLNEEEMYGFTVKGASFTYTEQGGMFYGVYLYDVPATANVQWREKIRSVDEATKWLQSLGIQEEVPRRYYSGEETLDKIVKQLENKGIVANHDDFFDVS